MLLLLKLVYLLLDLPVLSFKSIYILFRVASLHYSNIDLFLSHFFSALDSNWLPSAGIPLCPLFDITLMLITHARTDTILWLVTHHLEVVVLGTGPLLLEEGS
jgi:hypothetical protein